MKILKKDKERFGVEPITEKMVATRHRWFGNILKIPVDFVVVRVDQIERSKINRGRSTKKNYTRNY